ncbi:MULTISPECIES: hypothetical protein [Brucella]|uniref:hypothetical protein n=1 Tax=Brucella TaxID=234 RepID=UPI00124DABAC|nr:MULTISPECIES: hypothetical protein [Brucella]KAB2773248.1 hypothetical protein F9L00_24780 [Brucella anthropi]MBR7650700.1 hypothetical protein [Brucella oryzae]MDG9792428.1 hypothetical protein [Brucella anthropi]MDH0582300.1 hypothetical protein [Brucella anthropi]MDH0819161.1 hypothetical protein [Brucella anthropi]
MNKTEFSHFVLEILSTVTTIPPQEVGRLALTFRHQIDGIAANIDSSTTNAVLQALYRSAKEVKRELENEQSLQDARKLAWGERSNEWLTVTEILKERLPGLPRRRDDLKAYLERHGLTGDPLICRKRERSGRGVEYHRSVLTRSAIAQRRVPVKASQIDAGELASWIATKRLEQPGLTPSGLREAYKLHLRTTGNKGNVPSLRDFRRVIRLVAKEGR